MEARLGVVRPCLEGRCAEAFIQCISHCLELASKTCMQHSSVKIGRQAKKKTHLAPALADLDGPKGALAIVRRQVGKAGECDVERRTRLAVGQQGGADDVDEGVALVGANEDGPRERHMQRLVC